MYTRNQAKLIIKESGVKKYKIAEEAGIHTTTLSKWLNGHTEMEFHLFTKLNNVLDEYVKIFNIKVWIYIFLK